MRVGIKLTKEQRQEIEAEAKKEFESELWRECMLAAISSNRNMTISELAEGADVYVEEFNKRYEKRI